METQTSHAVALVSNSDRPPPPPGNSDTNKPSWKYSYTQITAACIVHLLTIQAGVNMAFSAILLPQAAKKDSDLVIEPWEAPWIASLVTISLPIGSLISGPLMDKFGRRNVSLFICIPYLISWILIYWAQSVVWLYFGRVLAGAAGGLSNVAIFYTSETAHPLWRPMLLGLNSVCVSIGILLTSVFGMWFHWRIVAAIFGGITAVIFVLLTVLPESPHWLLSFGNGARDIHRVDRARKAVRWFNRRDSLAERELIQLLTTYRANNTTPLVKTKETLKQKWESLKQPKIYKPIILLLLIFFLQQNCGSYVIVFYAIDLFNELGGQFGFLNDYGAMVLMGVIRVIMAIFAVILSRRFGRRTLCIISGMGMGITMLSASVCLEIGDSSNKIPTLVCVLSFVCFGAIGWQTIPWALTGELLPTRVRAMVGGVMISYTYLLMFVVVQTFPALKGLIEAKGVFLVFSFFSFLGTVFIWKFLPETFGKSLAEIEQFFK